MEQTKRNVRHDVFIWCGTGSGLHPRLGATWPRLSTTTVEPDTNVMHEAQSLSKWRRSSDSLIENKAFGLIREGRKA